MGLQDRDYYWDKRDDLEGRKKAQGQQEKPAAPFISPETFARVAREQARNRATGARREGSVNWLALAGLLFIVVCAVVGFVQILGWIKPWHGV